MKLMVAWVILIYGLLVAVGGVMGYVRAQSLPSLLAGGISGLLLIGAAVAMMRGSFQLGWWAALIIALLLLARFGAAAVNEFKMMPGGLMIILSIIAIIALLFGRTAMRA
ncbi:MAG: TMEM14 family protein [Pyrinomonadaceae bacterium]|nr:TMEM14 family protein [Pyrinomonadaceae bacterium]